MKTHVYISQVSYLFLSALGLFVSLCTLTFPMMSSSHLNAV